MTNTFRYAWYCDARSRFHKTVTIGFGHGYIRFGDGWEPSPKTLFLVVNSGMFILTYIFPKFLGLGPSYLWVVRLKGKVYAYYSHSVPYLLLASHHPTFYLSLHFTFFFFYSHFLTNDSFLTFPIQLINHLPTPQDGDSLNLISP